MCLGIPGKVVETYTEHDLLMGKVDFGGVMKRVCLEHTANVQPGQFVIVHVGFALQVIDEEEARQVFSFLESIQELNDLQSEQALEVAPADAREEQTGLSQPSPSLSRD